MISCSTEGGIGISFPLTLKHSISHVVDIDVDKAPHRSDDLNKTSGVHVVINGFSKRKTDRVKDMCLQ